MTAPSFIFSNPADYRAQWTVAAVKKLQSERLADPDTGIDAGSRWLFHGTTLKSLARIRSKGLQPKCGKLVREVYGEDLKQKGIKCPKLIFFADAKYIAEPLGAIVYHLGLAHGTEDPWTVVTRGMLANEGALLVIENKGRIFQHGKDSTSRTATGFIEYDVPSTVEIDDFWTDEPQEVAHVITGPVLVDLLKEARDYAWQKLVNNEKRTAANPPGFNDAFWRWFKQSAVVDKRGQPLVVYHGSPDVRALYNEGFKSLTRGEMYFATDSWRVANTYTDDRRAFDYQHAEPQVVPLYLSIQNPKIVNAWGKNWQNTAKHIDEAKAAGHDGVIILFSVDDYRHSKKSKPSTVYAFFKSSQAKSALDHQMLSRVDRKPIPGAVPNDGTWDADDPKITSNPRVRR
jgi:hypothetical protein